MRGRDITGTPHEAIRLYAICELTNWTHLPVAGGLYDQDPDFIDAMMIIAKVKGEYEKSKSSRDKGAMMGKRPPRPPSRRRR